MRDTHLQGIQPSMQSAVSMVIDTYHDRTRRLHQSITAAGWTRPVATGM